MKNVFLTGSTGRLGKTVLRVFSGSVVVHPWSLSRGGDLSSRRPAEVVPDGTECVLNCAAVSSVAGCRKNPLSAFKLNSLWPSRLAVFCAETGKRLVHISTDLVYAGGVPPYTEESPAVPKSFYGWTKLLGDIAVQHRNTDALVVRTSVLIGKAGAPNPTFTEDILSGTATQFYVDSFRNHTDIEALASFLLQNLSSSLSGLVLAAAPYSVSRAAYAYSVLKHSIDLAVAPPTVPHDLTLRPLVRLTKNSF